MKSVGNMLHSRDGWIILAIFNARESCNVDTAFLAEFCKAHGLQFSVVPDESTNKVHIVFFSHFVRGLEKIVGCVRVLWFVRASDW